MPVRTGQQARDTYKYVFKVGNRIVHGGITNDLERRGREHQQEGQTATSNRWDAGPPKKQLGTEMGPR